MNKNVIEFIILKYTIKYHFDYLRRKCFHVKYYLNISVFENFAPTSSESLVIELNENVNLVEEKFYIDKGHFIYLTCEGTSNCVSKFSLKVFSNF